MELIACPVGSNLFKFLIGPALPEFSRYPILNLDIRIESLSVTFHGNDLIVDLMLELNYGRRYGMLGKMVVESPLF
ncbi:hypothetical protein ISN44_As09g024910 [Arabidopsis suecica]|uniref:Uncharacterized protein n=1 Tax=Arabidopsis suecica TaxID=45249 RepID=A0A8T2AKD5_ARASU|nr:hypothetical protein ISN44_As09g024910 [Arabidopsis suecica]